VVPFASGDNDFDRFFRYRFAATAILLSLNRSHEAFRGLADFIRRHGGKLKYVELDSKKIRFAFRRGHYKEYASHGYVIAAELEAVLPDLAAAAAFLEAVGGLS
jgi:hypothetical protein